MEKKENHRYFRPDELRTLHEMGFKESDTMDGFFTHILCGDRLFDFTATSVVCVIKLMWRLGYQDGADDLRSDMKKLLDIR